MALLMLLLLLLLPAMMPVLLLVMLLGDQVGHWVFEVSVEETGWW